jgi:hypothetical protein
MDARRFVRDLLTGRFGSRALAGQLGRARLDGAGQPTGQRPLAGRQTPALYRTLRTTTATTAPSTLTRHGSPEAGCRNVMYSSRSAPVEGRAIATSCDRDDSASSSKAGHVAQDIGPSGDALRAARCECGGGPVSGTPAESPVKLITCGARADVCENRDYISRFELARRACTWKRTPRSSHLPAPSLITSLLRPEESATTKANDGGAGLSRDRPVQCPRSMRRA